MNFDNYYVIAEVPKRPIKPRMPDEHTSDNLRKYSDDLAVWEMKIKDYRQIMKGYRQESNKLLHKFKEDALKEVGLLGTKWADKAWNKAYEDGHASGYNEIFQHLEDLADIILTKV